MFRSQARERRRSFLEVLTRVLPEYNGNRQSVAICLHIVALFVCVLAASCITAAQSGASGDQLAISYAQQSIAAMTGGIAVNDITLTSKVTSTTGSTYDTGTAIFSAKGISESRVDLNLSAGMRSDARTLGTYGVPNGAWQQDGGIVTPYAQHNCWTDAAWFFPVLSALTQTANGAFVYKYVGPEEYNGVKVQHIQAFQSTSQNSDLARLSAIDFYLDAGSLLPLDIKFYVHADADMNTNIQEEIRFSGYQPVNGVQIPFYISACSTEISTLTWQ